MTILWFGIAKFLVSLVLLWIASLPLINYYRKNGRAPMQARRYIPLFLVLIVIIVTPFKLAPGIEAKQAIMSFDTPIRQVQRTDAIPRKEYGAPDNQDAINTILEQGQK